MLKSALAMPQASYEGEWLHPTIHEMAAAYLFHLARNHPFIDGNKRAALAATIGFLGLNGLRVVAPADALYALVMRIARGEATKADAATFLEKHTRRRRYSGSP